MGGYKHKRKLEMPEIPNEVWKEVIGYNGDYMVSNFGRVISIKHERPILLSGRDRKGNGYLSVALFLNNKGKHFSVHRLVADAFLPNINNLPIVNHKNKMKHDNRVENLEWVSAQQNVIHGKTFANFVVLGSSESRIADAMIPMVKQLVPLK